MSSLLEERPSPMQLRAALEEMVVKDLLGPAGGPNEEVYERNVRDRYLVGVLAPPQHGSGVEASSPVGVDDGDDEIPHIPDELPKGGTDSLEDGPTDRDRGKGSRLYLSFILTQT